MAKTKGGGRTRGKLIVISASGLAQVGGTATATTPAPAPPVNEFNKFASTTAGDAWGKGLYGDYTSNLPSNEYGAVKNYTGSGYGAVNDILRDGKYDPAKFPDSNVTKTIQGLDSAIENAPATDRNIVVRRGMSGGILSGLKAGDEFVDDGFGSTSVKPTWKWKGWATEIHIPKGTKGMYVSKISSVGGGEYEFLLHRSAAFRILKVGTGWDNPTILEYIGKSLP